MQFTQGSYFVVFSSAQQFLTAVRRRSRITNSPAQSFQQAPIYEKYFSKITNIKPQLIISAEQH